jgi:predicted nucleic acid-binding protein
MPDYVLDTSAILSVLYHEDGANQVMEVLDGARSQPFGTRTDVLVPFVALMEVEYQLLHRLSSREVEEVLIIVESWPIRVHESTPEWRHQAARVKATSRLSVADAWIASLAILRQGELVHKDPEFDQVAGLKVLRLPYKKGMAWNRSSGLLSLGRPGDYIGD